MTSAVHDGFLDFSQALEVGYLKNELVIRVVSDPVELRDFDVWSYTNCNHRYIDFTAELRLTPVYNNQFNDKRKITTSSLSASREYTENVSYRWGTQSVPRKTVDLEHYILGNFIYYFHSNIFKKLKKN